MAPHRTRVAPSAPLARACVLAITLFFTASLARAEPELTLRWTTPPNLASCPDHAWAMQRISEQLGHDPSRDVARGVLATVTIATRPTGVALDLETSFNGSTGARTIEGASCTELSEAAILIIALSVSEAGVHAEQATRPPPAAARPAPPPPSQIGPTTRQEGDRLGFAARVDLVLALGLWGSMRRPAWGPGLALALERGMFRAELAGLWLPPQETRAKQRRVDASLGAARAAGCLLFGRGRVRGGPCLGVEFGGVRARSSVVAHTWWAAIFGGARLHAALISRLSLVLQADLIGALARPRLTSDTQGTLLESLPLQLRAMAGPELRF